MNTLHSCTYFSGLFCWLVFIDGMFGNVLVSLCPFLQNIYKKDEENILQNH